MKRPSRVRCVWILLVCAAWIMGLLGATSGQEAKNLADEVVVPRDAATICEALSMVAEGGTIVLDPPEDIHRESVVIDVAGLSIRGRKPTIILQSGDAEPAITVAAEGVSLRDLTIQAERVGIRIEADECTLGEISVEGAPTGIELIGAARCVLTDVTVIEGEIGVELSSSRRARLERLTIENTTDVGLWLSDSSDNTIVESAILTAETGLRIDQSSAGNLVLELTIEDCNDIGIHLNLSEENHLEGAHISRASIGILVETATGNTVQGCAIEEAGRDGILIRQSAQIRVLANRVVGAEGAGIRLIQSSESALSHNDLRGCGDGGIDVEGGSRNLLMANVIRESTIGIRIAGSDDGRELRNQIERCETDGIALLACSGHQLLDNTIRACGSGIRLEAATDHTLLRNSISAISATLGVSGGGTEGFGVGLYRGSDGNLIGSGEIDHADVGLDISDSGRLDVIDNHVNDCGTGLSLIGAGPSIRIERNHIEGNRIGLVFYGDIAPVLASNTFQNSQSLDLENRSDVSIHAAGNWWATLGPSVSGDVLLESSSWAGVVALGTAHGAADEILGRVLELWVEAIGYRAIDLIGIGSDENLLSALRDGDIDVAWWSPSGEDTGLPAGVRTFASEAQEGWIAVASNERLEGLGAPTLAGLFATLLTGSERIRFAAPSGLGSDVYGALVAAYAPTPSSATMTWVRDTAEAEAMVKLGGADVAIVDELEETLTFGAFSPLEDEHEILEGSPLVIVCREELLSKHPELVDVLTDLAGKLSTDDLHEMISRVRLLGEAPEAVARRGLPSIVGDED